MQSRGRLVAMEEEGRACFQGMEQFVHAGEEVLIYASVGSFQITWLTLLSTILQIL
jgi:hypothetical protein